MASFLSLQYRDIQLHLWYQLRGKGQCLLTLLVERRVWCARKAAQNPGIAVRHVITVLAIDGHAVADVQITRMGEFIVIYVPAVEGTPGAGGTVSRPFAERVTGNCLANRVAC